MAKTDIRIAGGRFLEKGETRCTPAQERPREAGPRPRGERARAQQKKGLARQRDLRPVRAQGGQDPSEKRGWLPNHKKKTEKKQTRTGNGVGNARKKGSEKVHDGPVSHQRGEKGAAGAKRRSKGKNPLQKAKKGMKSKNRVLAGRKRGAKKNRNDLSSPTE